MAIDVSFRDGYSTSAQDLSRFNKNFIINSGVANDGLKVSQSVVPAMSVLVTAGTSYFYGTGTTADTMFEFYSDSTETVTIPTAAAQARIDIVCCKVDASTGASSFVVVSGTPSGSPAVPATPASHYKLAEVAVGASVTTITNANITDTRSSVFVAPTGTRNQGLINGYIVTSVAGNNLTVSVSTSFTSVVNPTITNPVGIWIGGNLRWITSALTFTQTGGTSPLNLGALEFRTLANPLFAYIQWNTTTNALNLIASRISGARKMSKFVNSATDGKGALGIVNYNSNDDVVLVDRFEVTVNASNNFTSTGQVYGEPIQESEWYAYTAQVSATGSMTYTSIAYQTTRYKVIPNGIKVVIAINATTGGTASSTINVSLPFAIGSGIFSDNVAMSCQIISAGANTSGQVRFGGSGILKFLRDDAANWTLGANSFVQYIGDIEI